MVIETGIRKPEDRTFCAMGCGAVMVHLVGTKRAYPDLCTACERKVLYTMEKRGGSLSKFKKLKLKK